MAEIVVGLKVQGEADLAKLTESLKQAGVQAEVLSTEKFGKLSKASSALSKSINRVANELDPTAAATAKYERQVKLLTKAIEIDAANQEKYNRLLAEAKRRHEEATQPAQQHTSALSELANRYAATAVVVAAATAALKVGIQASLEAEESAARLAFAVQMKGDAYGATAEQLTNLAQELASLTRFEDDAIMKAEAILLRFDSIDGSNIEQITRLTLDFAEATGRDASSAAEALAKALEAPGENLKALKDAGILLDDQQVEMIRTMEELNGTVSAQAVLIEALEGKIGGLGKKMGETRDGQIVRFKEALEEIGKSMGSGALALAFGTQAEASPALQAILDQEEATRKAAEAAKLASQVIVTNYAPALKQLTDQVNENNSASAKAKEENDRWNAAMDEATDKMIKETAEAKKLADEIARIRENLQATSNIAPLDVVTPPATAPYLTSTGQSVPAAMADEYREYLDLIGQGETIETRINDLVNAGLITREQADAALAAQLDTTVKMVDATDELEEEWKRFQAQVEENFIRGVQTALADFFVAVFEGGEDAMANFADALKDLLFKTLAEYLAQWIITQAKMLAASLARIAKEKAAQQAANAAGGGGGTGGALSSLSGIGGFAVAAVAFVGAAFALVNTINKNREGNRYDTQSFVNFEGGQMTASWQGKLDQTGPKIAQEMANLLQTLQNATGAFITGIAEAWINIKNDKSLFDAVVNDVVIGTFNTMEEAIIAAAKEVFLNTDLSKTLDPIVKQLIANYEGKDPKAFGEAVQKVQGIMDSLSGLSEIEIALRNLPSQAAALSSELAAMGVSLGDAQNVAAQWRIQQMQNLRDQITGHQQTAAEEMAERQRQATMFNAELALMRAELEMKRAELIAKGAVAQTSASIAKADIEAQQTKLQADGELLKARIDVENADLNVRKAALEAQSSIVGASVDLLNTQLSAIDALIASLPTAIDFKEIKIDRGGGGGGGRVRTSGPSREDRRDSVNQTLGDLAAELLPALVAQSRDLTERFAELREEMTALGMSTAELDRLEAEHRARLAEQAQQEVGQYTQNPYQQKLAQILRWGVEMRQVYTELGLSLEEVEAAEKARLETLGQQALAALGSPMAEAAARALQLQQAIDFLRANFEELGLSAEDVGQAIQEAADSWGLDILDNLLKYVEDEELRAQLVQARYEIEIGMLQAQFEILVAMGILAPEIEAAIRKAFGALPTEAPVLGGGSGGGFSGGTGGGPRTVGGGQDDKLERLRRAIDRLREFYEDLYQDEALSPLSLADRYALAAQEYADTLAAAQAGDVEAIEALPDVAAQYLDLASQMFGTSTASYQAIFEQVAQQVADLIGAFEETDNWADLRDRLSDFSWDFWHMQDYLEDIRDNTSEGGFGDTGTAEARTASGSAARTLAAQFSASSSGRATIYRNVPGLPSNVVVYQPTAAGGAGADIARLDRSVERLGIKLERALEKLGKAQQSAAEQRVRAAGGRPR